MCAVILFFLHTFTTIHQVVQYILDLNDNRFSDAVIRQFTGNICALSVQKFSSNVIEKVGSGVEVISVSFIFCLVYPSCRTHYAENNRRGTP